ncbi:MAG: DegT/DnrJ/EryC1/StrS family aminotransferase [Acidimicrobiia bacterium]|nr:DegT/DnrJ/EryC1/StrS family aminotransferase [Acidimicrobiia bacterium]
MTSATGGAGCSAPSVPFLDLASMHADVRDELDAVWATAVRTGSFIGGPAVERFEDEWARYCGAAHAVGVANGTDALELAMRALGIGPGHEVVVPTNTFIATAAAVVATGATPRYADVDDTTLLLTPETFRAALTPRCVAVIPVHLYGQPVDMDAIGKVAADAGLVVVEDAAQAHGATWRDRRVGSFGHAACFSFYPGKNLGAFGDGGAVVTHDGGLAARVRSLANHGRSPTSRHHHVEVGRNSRLDALQAGVLSVKLARLDAWNDGRRRAAERYRQRLGGTSVAPVAQDESAQSAYHLAVVRSAHRDELERVLNTSGIGTGVHYPVPCHRQEGFVSSAGRPLPVADRAAEEILSLPMSPHLGLDAVDRVCDVILAWADGRREDGDA